MPVNSIVRTVAAIAVAVALTACRADFELKRFTQDTDLYRVALRELRHRHWDNAVAGRAIR